MRVRFFQSVLYRYSSKDKATDYESEDGGSIPSTDIMEDYNMGKKCSKVVLNKYNNLAEVECHLNNNEEVTLFIDTVKKYVTIGFDANYIRISDFGCAGEIGTILGSNLQYEYYYGKKLYFVNHTQFAELFNPYIISNRLYYCVDNIAPYSIY